LSDPFNVHEQLVPFLVVRTREKGTNKRFDRVTGVGVLQRSSGPTRHELLVKLLFPPFGFAKERHEFVRYVLETSSAELAQYFYKSFIFVPRLLTSSVCAFPVVRIQAYHITCHSDATKASRAAITGVYLDLRQERTREQHVANQELHQRRLRIEHGNSSVKRCRIVKDRSRRWKQGVRDLVMELCGASLNLAHFVARKIWRRRGVSPVRCRAHRLQRRKPFRGLLVLMDTIFDLLQTAIN
jgi:hypothetical protein